MKELTQLLKEIHIKNLVSQDLPVITGIKIDSRQITAGDLFVAIPGTKKDGHQFIPDALQRGAAAVIGTRVYANLSKPCPVYVQVKDSRQALAQITAAWYE